MLFWEWISVFQFPWQISRCSNAACTWRKVIFGRCPENCWKLISLSQRLLWVFRVVSWIMVMLRYDRLGIYAGIFW